LRILAESARHGLKFADPVWTFTLQPGARKVLRYTVEFDTDCTLKPDDLEIWNSLHGNCP
jgi:hypothetical protein